MYSLDTLDLIRQFEVGLPGGETGDIRRRRVIPEEAKPAQESRGTEDESRTALYWHYDAVAKRVIYR